MTTDSCRQNKQASGCLITQRRMHNQRKANVTAALALHMTQEDEGDFS